MNRESLREQDRKKKRRLSHHVDVCVEVFNISVHWLSCNYVGSLNIIYFT